MNKIHNNDVNGLVSLKTELYFSYSDGTGRLYETWDEMVSYWAEEYGSKAAADKHFRKDGYGVIHNEASTPIMTAPVSGPLTKAQKSDLMTRAAEYINNR